MPRLTKEEVQEKIGRYIDQALQGIPNEEPKLDYKRGYPDLKENVSKSKFLKLATAIANTLGEHGFIVYGFNPDDHNKQFFYPPSFSDTKFRDDNEINGLIAGNVSHSFEIVRYPIEYKGNPLEVLYIPPTNEKPYLVRRWYDKKGNAQENQIFVRKGTGTFNANKGDIDTMYFYRGKEQNIIPDYDLEFNCTDINEGRLKGEERLRKIELILENTGQRPFTISKIEMILKDGGIVEINDPVTEYRDDVTRSKLRNVIFRPKDMKYFSMDLTGAIYDLSELIEFEIIFKAYLSNSRVISKSYNFANTPPSAKSPTGGYLPPMSASRGSSF